MVKEKKSKVVGAHTLPAHLPSELQYSSTVGLLVVEFAKSSLPGTLH